jgi:hypothetical protein
MKPFLNKKEKENQSSWQCEIMIIQDATVKRYSQKKHLIAAVIRQKKIVVVRPETINVV